ncbi:MAG: response regulator [Acidobacteriota bacterium]|nr:MAG: response regulator [Acidobacteriota bacterium]
MQEKSGDSEKKKTIVLVDDSQLFLHIEEALLDRKRFNLVKATTGQQALDLIKRHKPSLVLLDFMLPDINGTEVTKRVREDPEVTDIPIVIITSKGSEEQKLECFKAGCNDFITKPINGSVLKLKVDRLVNIAPRMSYHTIVKLLEDGKNKNDFVLSSSINVSETGVLLETFKEFEVGTKVALQFYTTVSREPVVAQGFIVRAQEKGFRGAKGYAVTFSYVSDEDRTKIRALMKHTG